jgi:ubiquinone/menaquinone biosynthesis C-methylase UbiE
MSDPWYVTAFGGHYTDLYHHRNDDDARRAIECVGRHHDLDPQAGPVLDLCCGTGRHAMQWLTRYGAGIDIVGLDLAPNLLSDAARDAALSGHDLSLTRGDMRFLPFPKATFRLVLNLFTSFGYFTDQAENQAVFNEVRRVLREASGHFIFDHMNPARLRGTLVPESRRRTASGVQVIEKRRIDEEQRRVEKTIEIQDGGETRRILESVRFYERDEVHAMAERAGLVIEQELGDFDDSPLTTDSPRAIYVMKT